MLFSISSQVRQIGQLYVTRLFNLQSESVPRASQKQVTGLKNEDGRDQIHSMQLYSLCQSPLCDQGCNGGKKGMRLFPCEGRSLLCPCRATHAQEEAPGLHECQQPPAPLPPSPALCSWGQSTDRRDGQGGSAWPLHPHPTGISSSCKAARYMK